MVNIPPELKAAFRDFGPDKHCVGSFAETEGGISVNPNNPDAVKWCAMGWLLHTQPDTIEWREDQADIYTLIERIARDLGYNNISEANDALGYRFIEILRRET